MRTAARPAYLTPVYRCGHRPSRRVPHPTDHTAELCCSCGATFPRREE